MIHVYRRQRQIYFSRKLTITIHTNISKIETDAPLPDWSRVDVKAYLNDRAER